jgi:CRP-like cAMP-binding protein
MKTILVIEDNLEVRENLQETLELYGYTVHTAADGTEGVTQALRFPPDLIICDVMMPKLDGFGVLNILSKKPATADIPFVFLTAKSEKEDLRRGMNLGADDYLTKPFYKDELLQVIETRLKKSDRLKTEFSKTQAGWQAFVNEAKGYEALHKLSTEYNVRTFPKKTILFEENAQARYLYFIISGKVKTYKTSEYGKELIIRVLGKGDFVGYSALMKNEPFNFSAATLEDTEVSMIPQDDFQALLYGNRDVSSRLIKMLADNVQEKEAHLLQLAYHSVRKRTAEVLLQLYDQLDPKEAGIRMLREDLASMVGTAKESVIRTLSEFKSDGYIQIDNGVIYVLEMERLGAVPE